MLISRCQIVSGSAKESFFLSFFKRNRGEGGGGVILSVLSFPTAGLKTALLSVLTLILRFERLQPIAAAEVVEVEKRKKKIFKN